MSDNSLPLRWGLLSTARINRALIKPLRASKRNKLVAVASRDGVRSKNYAEEWKIFKAYGSYDELLSDPEIDVIYNSLPNSLHAEWTVKAAQAGKHILCEKPLALSLEEIHEIKSAAERANVVIAEAFMYRHHPQTLKVKEIVDSGMIGELCLIRGSFTFKLSRMEDYRLDPILGGGSIWDIGCYPISYIRTIIGKEPIEVFGWQWTGRGGVDEVFSGQMRFAGNILTQFDCGFRSPYRVSMEIVGTHGVLLIPNPFKPGRKEKVILTRDGEKQTIQISGPELYIGEVEDVADAILEKKTPRISLEDSAGNVATILALLRSAREGISIAF
jgi:predicted dehydrogenase